MRADHSRIPEPVQPARRGRASARHVPAERDLSVHLSFEVFWLVHASRSFQDGYEETAIQDSALLHGRNLLEFTAPSPPRWGWWIGDVGGLALAPSDEFTQWKLLIDTKVSHMGEGRLAPARWPVPYDRSRLVRLSHFLLERLRAATDGSRDPRAILIGRITALGLDYVRDGVTEAIVELDRLSRDDMTA